jgi:hypothetical protein
MGPMSKDAVKATDLKTDLKIAGVVVIILSALIILWVFRL